MGGLGPTAPGSRGGGGGLPLQQTRLTWFKALPRGPSPTPHLGWGLHAHAPVPCSRCRGVSSRVEPRGGARSRRCLWLLLLSLGRACCLNAAALWQVLGPIAGPCVDMSTFALGGGALVMQPPRARARGSRGVVLGGAGAFSWLAAEPSCVRGRVQGSLPYADTLLPCAPRGGTTGFAASHAPRSSLGLSRAALGSGRCKRPSRGLQTQRSLCTEGRHLVCCNCGAGCGRVPGAGVSWTVRLPLCPVALPQSEGTSCPCVSEPELPAVGVCNAKASQGLVGEPGVS